MLSRHEISGLPRLGGDGFCGPYADHQHHDGAGNRVYGEWCARFGDPATELACVYHCIQPDRRCGKGLGNYRRRWFCECKPCAQSRLIAGGSLLHRDLSHERRHDQYGILGNSCGCAGQHCAGSVAGYARGAGGAGREQGICRSGRSVGGAGKPDLDRRSTHRAPFSNRRSHTNIAGRG